MLSLPSVVKIYLHAAPVNLHYSFDRLAGIVRDEMGRDPLCGHLLLLWGIEAGSVRRHKRFSLEAHRAAHAAQR